MKKHCYNSLSHFYENVKNVVGCPEYYDYEKYNNPKWMGMELSDIHKYKFSYPMGIEKLSQFKDVELQKDVNEKFWNQFDGFDIDVDRMMENLDFLVDTRKKRKLPKTMDIYIQIGENCTVEYNQMLCKTYAAIKIIDKLESLGVRCAVYACNTFETLKKSGGKGDQGYLEVCIKQHADSVNLGAICTAISPWVFRHYFLLHTAGHFSNCDVHGGLSYTRPMPEDVTGIIIQPGQCLELSNANKFIENIKVA